MSELPTPWRNEPVLDKLLISDEFYGLKRRQQRRKRRGGGENAKIHETDMVAINFNNSVFVESNLYLRCVLVQCKYPIL